MDLHAPVRHYGLHPLKLLARSMERVMDAGDELERARAQALVYKRASLYRRAKP